MRQRFYQNLESIRGFAALMIVVYHIPWENHARHLYVISNLWIFVDLFFVLSGFVIASAYIRRLCNLRDVVDFMKRRIFRVYPLHLVTTVAAMALIAVRYAIIPTDTINTKHIDATWLLLVPSNLTLTHAWGWTNDAILNVPSWSISTELIAYIVFSLVCMLTPAPARRVWIFALIAAVAATILVSASDSLEAPMSLRPFRCLLGFGLGVVTFHAVDRWPKNLGAGEAMGIQLALWLAIFTALAMLTRESKILYAVPFLFAFLIGIMAKDNRSWMLRIWNNGPMTFLGVISYSIYLNHIVLLSVLDAAIKGVLPGMIVQGGGQSGMWKADLVTVAFFAATIGLSYLTYRFIELPWRERGRLPLRKPRDAARLAMMSGHSPETGGADRPGS